MKNITLITAAVVACLGATVNASAATAGSPVQPACLATTFSVDQSSSAWYTNATITVKNNCANVIDLNNAVVSFATNSNNISNVWTWPFSSSAATYQNGAVSFTLLNQGDAYSTTKLNTGSSVGLNFGINLNGTPFALSAAQKTLQVIPNGTPVVSNGEIDIVVNPAGTSGISGTEAITVTSGSTYSNTINNAVWNQSSTYKVTGLSYGTYNISANPIGGYNAIVTPASIAVNSATPQRVNVTYQLQPQVGSISVTLPVAPLANIANTTVVTVKDLTNNQVYTQSPSWNSTATFSQLPAKDLYTVSVPNVTNGQYIAKPNSINNITVAANQNSPVTLGYQVVQVTTTPVTFNLTGLSNANASLKVVDSYGNVYNYPNLGNGSVAEQLPTNSSYNVTATAQGLTAKVTPNSFNTPFSTPVSVTFTQAPAGNAFFSPYIDVTVNANWNANQPGDLTNYLATTGVKSLHTAFITDAGSCVPAWAGISSMPATGASPWGASWFSNLHTQGVAYVVAFGGANGTDISQNCSNTALIKAYQQVIAAYNPDGLDFDIEGQLVANPTAYQNIITALVTIQKQYPNLPISFTLPVMPEGLTWNGLDVVTRAKQAGLNFTINIMAMDYGPSYNGDMAQYAIQAVQSLENQLANIYGTSKTPAQLYNMIEVTPMIGVNDVNVERFTLADASTLLGYAQQNGLKGVSMWSVARDNPCTDQWASATCSGGVNGVALQTKMGDFSKAFMGQ